MSDFSFEKTSIDFFSVSNINVSSVQCPVCLGSSRLRDHIFTIHPSDKQKVQLRECSACGHWWINPLVSQKILNQLYKDNSRYVVGKESLVLGKNTPSHSIELSTRERVVLGSEASNTGKYLEVGIGKGKLYKKMKALGWKCTGIDPGRSDDPEIYPSVEGLVDNETFDVLVANDVLEHLEDPTKMLKKLASHAHDASRLYMCFPNVDSVRARFQGAKWRMLRPFGHLHFFSEKSINHLCKESGWKITSMKKTDLIGLPKKKFPNLLFQAFVETFGLGDQWVLQAMKNV